MCFFFALCVVILIGLSAPTIGVCSKDGRRLQDRELIEIAIKNQGGMDMRGAASPSEYLDKYPECCNVIRKGELTFWQMTFWAPKSDFPGDFAVEVIVQNNPSITRGFATALYFMSGCGDIVEKNEIDRRSLETE